VEERVKNIYNSDDWHRELAKAGSGLVVLEARLMRGLGCFKLYAHDACDSVAAPGLADAPVGLASPLVDSVAAVI
jgi:hypothetical protein